MGRIKSFNDCGRLQLRTDLKPNENGAYPIYLWYELGKQTVRKSTNIWVTEIQWDKNKRKVKKHSSAEMLNNQLAKMKQEIDEQVFLSHQEGSLNLEKLREIVDGHYRKGKKPFADFIEICREAMTIRYKQDKIGVSVYENAICNLNTFEKFVVKTTGESQIDCSEVTIDLIDEYIIWRKDERGNSNETINKALTPLMRGASLSVSRGLMDANLLPQLEDKYLPKTSSMIEKNVKYLSEEQVRQFIALRERVKYPRTVEFMDMFLFAINACGLRISDIITLKWSEIDLDNRIINKVLVKGRKPHELYYNDMGADILQKWKGKNPEFVFGLLPTGFDTDDDITLKRGISKKSRTIAQSLGALGDKMNLPFRLTFHVARHTFAVMALNRGVEVHKVSVLMGHSSVGVTETTYAKFLPKKLQEEVQSKLNFTF